MKLKLQVTYVDAANGALVFKPLDSGLRGDLIYSALPARALHRCAVGQTVEAEIPLPDFYPVPPQTNFYPGIAAELAQVETRLIGFSWYKNSGSYPHNWEPIQKEIEEAIQRVRATGQPQVIPCCGYVDTGSVFIPYKPVRSA